MPYSGCPFDAEHQARRRAYVRRLLTEASAVIFDGVDRGHPLGELTDRAHRLVSDAMLEVLRMGLGDEEPRR